MRYSHTTIIIYSTTQSLVVKFDFGTHRKVLLTEIKQVFPAEEEKRDVWSFKWKTGCRQTSTAEIENENSHIYIGAIRKSADRKKNR